MKDFFLDTLWHLKRVEKEEEFFVYLLEPSGEEPEEIEAFSMEEYAISKNWTILPEQFGTGDKILYCRFDDSFIKKVFDQDRMVPVHELTESR